jgi:ribulose-5-phosphate 4-epimerase/fuculose-1-phosphate aldolase
MGNGSNKNNDQEWELRLKLAATYRIFDYLGWTSIIFNHITIRIPGPEHNFLINPFGLRYDEVTASNLVKVDANGKKVRGSNYEEWDINQAGFTIHSAIHNKIEDALCIMHTHTPAGLAVACKTDGLSNTNIYSSMIYDRISYHDFEGVALRDDEQERLVNSIGSNPLLILRNHGLLSTGRTIEEAFVRLWTLQMACETQVLTESMLGPNIEVTREATAFNMKEVRLFNDAPRKSDKSFDALLRIVDKIDPSYKS